MQQRESFKSRLGFILVSAGCAIGIGNVWRFPYVAGANGGGIFVLFYLLFLLIMGIPVLTMELAIGRAGRKSAIEAYKNIEKPKSKWHLHGWACLIGNGLLMMYYTTVAGWMFGYFLKFLTGTFSSGMETAAIQGVFKNLLGNPGEMILYMGIVVVAGFIVCSFGLQGGLEKVSKFMMISLLALIVVLAGNSLLLPGAKEGMSFYLLPDFGKAAEVGLGKVITAAMNQSFFTLSLGIGAMLIFGSYMKRDNTLGSESVRICILDTFVAVMSGTIIFPACYSFGIEPNAGPSLIFETLPPIFVNMTGGRIWGTLFFLFMTFASFTTVIAVFENLLATAIDTFGWSRKKSVIINGIIIFLGSLPALLGYNVWKGVRLLRGMDILDTEDFLVSYLFLPVGSLIFVLFCVTRWGWGFDKYLEEANAGDGFKLPKALKPYFQFVLPVLILVILVQGWL